MFPIPAEDRVLVRADWCKWGIERVTLCDAMGRVLVTQSVDSDFVVDVELDLSDLSGGIYFVTLVGDFGPATRRVIKR